LWHRPEIGIFHPAAKSAHFPAPRFPRDFPRTFRALDAGALPDPFRPYTGPLCCRDCRENKKGPQDALRAH
jgi:hypothetical protein